MKKTLILLLALLPVLVGCSKDQVSDEVRDIAWKAIDVPTQLTVIGDWTEAPIDRTSYEGHKAYAVTFTTKDDLLMGPIVIYVGRNPKIVLGQAPRF